jgi:hypothetical protein
MEMMIKEMQPLLREAGIKDDYLVIMDDSEILYAAFIKEGYDWLEHIYSILWKAAYNIKKLLPNELWERYKTWEDFDNHREVKLLKQALVHLSKAVRSHKKPDFFKKGRVRVEIKKRKKALGHVRTRS